MAGSRGRAFLTRLIERVAATSSRKRPTPNAQRPTLKRELVRLGSTGCQPVVRGSLPQTCVANTRRLPAQAEIHNGQDVRKPHRQDACAKADSVYSSELHPI